MVSSVVDFGISVVDSSGVLLGVVDSSIVVVIVVVVVVVIVVFVVVVVVWIVDVTVSEKLVVCKP